MPGRTMIKNINANHAAIGTFWCSTLEFEISAGG